MSNGFGLSALSLQLPAILALPLPLLGFTLTKKPLVNHSFNTTAVTRVPFARVCMLQLLVHATIHG